MATLQVQLKSGLVHQYDSGAVDTQEIYEDICNWFAEGLTRSGRFKEGIYESLEPNGGRLLLRRSEIASIQLFCTEEDNRAIEVARLLKRPAKEPQKAKRR